MKEKMKQLANYYKLYRFLFWSDMVVAVIGAGITLVIPLIVRYITNHVIHLENPLPMILKLAVLMLGLVVLEAFCNFYQAYYGHIMGAKMERDMRAEIFEHYQKLSFHFMITRRWASSSHESPTTSLRSASFYTTDRRMW